MRPARFSMTQTVIVAVALLAPGCSSDSNGPIPDNDVPAIASLDPGYAVEGDAAFNLFVHGQGFNMNSVVRWNGSDRVTTLTNPSPGVFVLRAAIHQTDIVAQSTAQITVFNPAPGGGVSNTVNFVVYDQSAVNPVPHISTVSPSTLNFEQDVTITIHGTNFVGGATVIWTPAATTTGYTRTTTFVNSTELTVMIPGVQVRPRGVGTLEVVNPTPGGGTSNPETVTVF